MTWPRAEQARNRASIPLKNLLFCKVSAQSLGPTQPCIQLVTRTLCPRKKRSGREADHSPTASVVFNDEWNYTSFPHYALMTCQGQLYVSSNDCEASNGWKILEKLIGSKEESNGRNLPTAAV